MAKSHTAYFVIFALKCCVLLCHINNKSPSPEPTNITSAITSFAERSLLANLCSPGQCYHRAPKFATHLGLKPAHPLTHITLCVLLLSGDIELNPGPRNASIFPCGCCEMPVNWSHRAICCDNCSVWYHKSCASMDTFDFNKIENQIEGESIFWPCFRCAHRNTSIWCSHRNTPSLTYNSFVLNVSNSFDPLRGDSNLNMASPDPVFLPARKSRTREPSRTRPWQRRENHRKKPL